FARAVANRVWAQFMGRGLVHPVDDLTVTNKASHPELFKTLVDDIRARKFDLKGYIREVVNSDTYQLADTGEVKEALPAWFERARVRPLSAEELMPSLRVATGHEAAMPKNSDSTEYFLRYFGELTDGQGHFQSSLAEHLFLDNAPQIRTLCQQGKGNLAHWIV